MILSWLIFDPRGEIYLEIFACRSGLVESIAVVMLSMEICPFDIAAAFCHVTSKVFYISQFTKSRMCKEIT